MRGSAPHIEESGSEKIGIGRLLAFFLRYFLPFSRAVAGTTLLALLVTGSDLVLPQLLKEAVDRYIVPASRQALVPGIEKSVPPEELLLADRGGTAFVLPGTLHRIADDELRRLEREKILLPEKYYASPEGGTADTIAARYPDFFLKAGGRYVISYADMEKLEKADLLYLRMPDVRGVARIAALFVGILVIGFALNFAQIFLVERTSQFIMHDVRMDIFSHLSARSMSFFTGNPVGRLVTRATSDVQNLHEMFSALFSSIFKDIFLIAGILGALLALSWRLSLACFALVPLLVAGAALFSYASHDAFREVRIKIASLNSMIQECLAGSSVVKAFCREDRMAERFGFINQENYRANMKQTVVFAVFTPLVDLARVCAFAIIVWYGGGQALREEISVGSLVVFLYYMRMFFTPVQDLAEKYNIVQSAFASLERIYLLFAERSAIEDQPGAPALTKCAGAVEFKQVTFGYHEGEHVLHDVSFRASPGETVAIVGLTGSGKTTIINLLERFYDIGRGSIEIDGVDIRALRQESLREHIGLVLQDVFLFAGTIRSNITLGHDGFTDEQIQEALRVANADRLLLRLPRGLDAEVSEGGRTLSAGERQLLAFARAILVNPAILVLDEATSNIDPVTEGLIQDALEKLMRGRTCIVIAHRFSTIKKADRILVLHKGRIVEQGTHEELLDRSGLYRRLYDLQYGDAAMSSF